MRSLNGLRVLNTRPLEQGKALTHSIQRHGGIAIECPALTITATDKIWLNALPDLGTIEQAIFTSTNAVTFFFNTLKEKKLPWPFSIQLIAIGHATAAALSQEGLKVHAVPEKSSSEHLINLQELVLVKQKPILLVKGEGGRTLIEETLRERHANLFIVSVYKRTMPQLNKGFLKSLWRNQMVDIILYSSEQALDNLFSLFGEEAYTWLCNTPCLVLSERLAKAASLRGIQKILIGSPEKIIEALHQFKQGLIDGK